MAFDNLQFEKTNHVVKITIDHPPANAWDLITMQAFEKAIDEVENDRGVRAVILTGAGEKCFSAGFDVRDAANAAVISPKGRELWQRIDRLDKPVIAAINGYAMGGGWELALACHFRIMANAPHVQVGLTELNLGIIPGWGGTQRLTRLVGRSHALDMILFSRRLNADQALEAGLVDRIVAPEMLPAKALELAEQLAERPPIAVRCVLRAMAAGRYEGMAAGLQIEAEGSAVVRETEDRNEGFRAFLEKRKPAFKGR